MNMTTHTDDLTSAYLQGLSLLYVEEEEEMRILLGDFLQRRVGTLLTASNGREGLELFREYRPDMVITDILMQDVDWLSMVEAIRQTDPHIPIIIITSAFNETDYLLKAIELGIDKYLMKPIHTAS